MAAGNERSMIGLCLIKIDNGGIKVKITIEIPEGDKCDGCRLRNREEQEDSCNLFFRNVDGGKCEKCLQLKPKTDYELLIEVFKEIGVIWSEYSFKGGPVIELFDPEGKVYLEFNRRKRFLGNEMDKNHPNHIT